MAKQWEARPVMATTCLSPLLGGFGSGVTETLLVTLAGVARLHRDGSSTWACLSPLLGGFGSGGVSSVAVSG